MGWIRPRGGIHLVVLPTWTRPGTEGVLGLRMEPGGEGRTPYPWALILMSAWCGSPRRGSEVFVERETALVAAALYPADGREGFYRLGEESEGQGFPVKAPRGEAGLEVVGWLTGFELEQMRALHVGEHLLRSPVSLAAVGLLTAALELRRNP